MPVSTKLKDSHLAVFTTKTTSTNRRKCSLSQKNPNWCSKTSGDKSKRQLSPKGSTLKTHQNFHLNKQNTILSMPELWPSLTVNFTKCQKRSNSSTTEMEPGRHMSGNTTSKTSWRNSGRLRRTSHRARGTTWLYLWISTQDQANTFLKLVVLLVTDQRDSKKILKEEEEISKKLPKVDLISIIFLCFLLFFLSCFFTFKIS